MTVLWMTKRAGFTMTGLELKSGSLFIGLSLSGHKSADKKPLTRSWRRKEGGWSKTGVSGPSNRWFFGVAAASAGKSMTPPSRQTASYRDGESPFEAYRRARLAGNRS